MHVPTFFLVPVLLLGATAPATAQAQDVEQFFDANCAACHTIGGGFKVGPDLKGVLDRQERQWLVDFIVDPNSKLGSDPYAIELQAKANGIPMPPLGVDALTASALLDYIVTKSDAVGDSPVLVEELVPFTALDIEQGEAWFTGANSFRNGAPACSSCHTTAGLGAWGGGALGPDLTQVSSRLGGRTSLTGWLGMPGSATMLPIFGKQKLTKEEIHALVAFLEKESESGADAAPSVTLSFLGTGVLAAIALLALFGFLWKGRYTATRVPMVEKSKR